MIPVQQCAEPVAGKVALAGPTRLIFLMSRACWPPP
jgi:hypothetical protein